MRQHIFCKEICKLLLLNGLLLGVAGAALAQDEAVINDNCAANAYRAFDFWLGEWDVYAQGKLAGHNKIERILGGCALSESWTGASGGKGHSYNAYDAKAHSWNQFWVDTNGLVLRLVGEAKDGGMQMIGLMSIDGEANVTVRHQITWTPMKNGHVRQEWKSSRSDSKEWQTVFDGIYVPKGSPPPEIMTDS